METEIRFQEFYTSSICHRFAKLNSRTRNAASELSKARPHSHHGANFCSTHLFALTRPKSHAIATFSEVCSNASAGSGLQGYGEKQVVAPGSLKSKLVQSLSPLPFACVNNSGAERVVEKLVVSGRKPLLILSHGNTNTLRKALKDHILHILQSICLIKQLQPIPAPLLDKKKVRLAHKAPGKD